MIAGEKNINELKKYFSGRADVLFAFLFGSQAKKTAGKISDLDVAVYFTPEGKGVEWEESDRHYPPENKIWDDLVDILKTENVDLVVLNRSPSNIDASVISEGMPLVVKDRSIFLDFALLTMHQSEDYAGFVDDYYAISQRSTSFSPRDKEKLKKIAGSLEEEMGAYGYFSVFDFTDYEEPHKRRDI